MSTWVDTFVIERWGLLTWFLGFWYIGEDPIYRALVDAGIEGKGKGDREVKVPKPLLGMEIPNSTIGYDWPQLRGSDSDSDCSE